MRLDDRLAFVTGGASGIGYATALTFAGMGAHVLIGDVDEAGNAATLEAIRAAGGKGEAFVLDVADRAAVASVAAAVHERHGKLDILANVAGISRTQPFLENDPAFIDRVTAVNYLGPINMCQAFLPPMIESGGGKIVNVASDAGRIGTSGGTVYAGTKGGVIAFTKSLAREVARHAINVNAVCPGPIDTPMLRRGPEKRNAAMIRMVPLRRVGQPQDIADAILYFASDRSSYITGQALSVSGGISMVD